MSIDAASNARNLNSIGAFISNVGFPVFIAILLIGVIFWQNKVAMEQAEKLSEVVIDNTKSNMDISSAVRALEQSSREHTNSLRSLEMSINKGE